MTKEQQDLLVAIGVSLYTLLYQLRATERMYTQQQLYDALAGLNAEPVEGR